MFCADECRNIFEKLLKTFYLFCLFIFSFPRVHNNVVAVSISGRYGDAAKNLAKNERRVRELKFQVEEERKNYQKLCELADKLQTKIRNQRKVIEDAVRSYPLH